LIDKILANIASNKFDSFLNDNYCELFYGFNTFWLKKAKFDFMNFNIFLVKYMFYLNNRRNL